MDIPKLTHATSLTIERDTELASCYTLSPYVVSASGRYEMLLRVVNRSDDPKQKIARIHYAASADGVRFVMGRQPVIAPGPQPADRGGCEDPTAVAFGDRWFVYYSGWDPDAQRSSLLLASGPDLEQLRKTNAVILDAALLPNAKEATVVQGADATWNLFFEYAKDGASRMGLAKSQAVTGPWIVAHDDAVPRRPTQWDSWHISTGPISMRDPQQPTMFYNGADAQGHWRIGWVAFDSTCSIIRARGDAPLVRPENVGDGTDIAFAASCVEQHDLTALYYSISDKDLVRAMFEWR